MKYQVSCKISFVSSSERDAVFMYLWGNKPTGLPGDTLNFGQTPQGYHAVSCLYRYDDQTQRDEVHNYLHSLSNVIKTVPGMIEKHSCNHDTDGVCTDNVVDQWGGLE